MPKFLEDMLIFIRKYSEIGVAFLVVGILGLIMIPVPSGILDFLLVINITLGMVILLLTLFTTSVLEFSTFPTVLLVTTMFRLGLNISSTRLILSTGEAGEVIDAFAGFVTGDNYIVGAIIFIIIIVVQMVVVTSGASRVSEVSARFTLDAMPGKQMAIDADLNSGLIDEETAKTRRRDLQREAGFYGAMDGASKFVKGDAIAGIIITIINLLGGILIFSMREGMGAMEALDRFGRLTIGDGLVSQVPALLISVASGILVTRSDSDNSFGSEVTKELFGVDKVLFIASVVLFSMGLIPAFPLIPFVLVAIMMGSVGYLVMEDDRAEVQIEAQQAEAQVASMEKEAETDVVTMFQVEPISVEIGYGLIPIVDEGSSGNLPSHITSIRGQFAKELGIIISPIRIRDNLQLGPNEYVINIKGNQIASGELYIDRYLVIDPGTQDFQIEGISTTEPAFGLDAMWIEERQKELIELKGYTVIEPVVVLVTHLKEVIKRHSHELLGRQEVKELLEIVKEDHDVVVDELIPDIMSLGEVQKVLQALLKEGVPIYDMVTILESLADNAIATDDIEVLTEYVRQKLGRTIAKNYVDSNNNISVMTIDQQLEEMIYQNIQKTTSGSIPILKPDLVTAIFDNINNLNDQLLSQGIRAVILASPKIRLAFKNLISHNFPDIAVISLTEIPNDIEITAVGVIGKNDS